MKRGLVIGESTTAREIAHCIGLPRVSLGRADQEILKRNRFVIHADMPPDVYPMGKWAWLFRTLATRVLYADSFWLQISSVMVVAGNGYVRPYRAADPINPIGIDGQVLAALEWALPGLGYPVATVRKSVLIDDQFIKWGMEMLRSERPMVAPTRMSPTCISDFATRVLRVADLEQEGLVHMASRGVGTYKDVLLTIAEIQGIDHPEITVAPMIVSTLTNVALAPTFKTRPWRSSIIDFLNRGNLLQ